jgi:hypothetical protein
VASYATPPTVVDASVADVRSSTPPVVALELHAVGVVESFEVRLSDLAALEMGLKGAALVCPRWCTQLGAKSHGGTSKLLVPRRRPPPPGRWSLGGAWLVLGRVLCVSIVASLLLLLPDHVGVSDGILRLAWCTEVEALRGHVGCRK